MAALALPAVAFASVAQPKSGRWKITDTGAPKDGSFTVGHGYVSHVTMPGENCDLAKVSVQGRQKLRLIHSGGYSDWVIGTADPSRRNPNDISGVVGEKVRIRVSGKTMSARLEMTFGILGSKKDNSGDLRVNGCDIPFDENPKR